LRGGQARIAGIGVGHVIHRAQKVEPEAHRRVERGKQSDDPSGGSRPPGVDEEQDREHQREQELVKSEIVARAVGIANGEEKMAMSTGVIVSGGAPEASEDPAHRQPQRHRIGVRQRRYFFLAAQVKVRQRRAHEAAERR
jgi:hypothetical protein